MCTEIPFFRSFFLFNVSVCCVCYCEVIFKYWVCLYGIRWWHVFFWKFVELYGGEWSSFHPLDVVSRYRDPQHQVGENYFTRLHIFPRISKKIHAICISLKCWALTIPRAGRVSRSKLHGSSVPCKFMKTGLLRDLGRKMIACMHIADQIEGLSMAVCDISIFWLYDLSARAPHVSLCTCGLARCTLTHLKASLLFIFRYQTHNNNLAESQHMLGRTTRTLCAFIWYISHLAILQYNIF